MVHPATGFHVASVHSIDVSAIAQSSARISADSADLIKSKCSLYVLLRENPASIGIDRPSRIPDCGLAGGRAGLRMMPDQLDRDPRGFPDCGRYEVRFSPTPRSVLVRVFNLEHRDAGHAMIQPNRCASHSRLGSVEFR